MPKMLIFSRPKYSSAGATRAAGAAAFFGAGATALAFAGCVCDATAEAEIQVLKHAMESSPAKNFVYGNLTTQKHALF